MLQIRLIYNASERWIEWLLPRRARATPLDPHYSLPGGQSLHHRPYNNNTILNNYNKLYNQNSLFIMSVSITIIISSGLG